MLKETKKNEPVSAINFNDNNFPPAIANQCKNKREALILSPNRRFLRTVLKYKKISNKISPRYDWYDPAPPELWTQDEADEASYLYKLKFSRYVHFETCLEHYQMFPVEIPFDDSFGFRRKYTPLALLNFSPDLILYSMKPVLVDVRSRDNIKQNWNWLYPAWRAAKSFAKDNGWHFCIIRNDFFVTPLFKNAEFLLRYRQYPSNEEYFGRLIGEMQRVENTTVHELLDGVSRNGGEYLKLMPQLWQMMDNNYIFFDVRQPLTMNTYISI